MKAYYINSYLAGCYNVRCLLPLQANGFDGDRTTFREDSRTPENKAKAIKDADIVVFHRPERKEALKVAKLLKQEGKKIVFDNDDTFKDYGGFKFNDYMDEERVKNGMKKLDNSISDFIKEADLVTCSTEFLKKEYQEIHNNVVVLPNCIDPFFWPEPAVNETDIVRIGITGSVGITQDIEPLTPIVKHYHKDPRVRLVLLSLPPNKENELYKKLYKDEFAFWEGVDMEWHPFVPASDYPEYLNNLKLDMVIIPRYDNYFNRCKSNLKFLENSMCGVPSICQSFPTGDSPYQQNPADKDNLLLAGNTEEFIAHIEKIIADRKFGRDLGMKARDYVIKNYNIEDKAHLWADEYSKLIK